MDCLRCGEVLGPHSDELTCGDCRSAFYNGYFWGIITGAAFAGSLMAWLLRG